MKCVFEAICRNDLTTLKMMASLYVKSFKTKMPIKLENGSLTTYFCDNSIEKGSIETHLCIRPKEGLGQGLPLHRGVDWFLIDSLFFYDLKVDNSANQTIEFDTQLNTATHKVKYYSTGCEDLMYESTTDLISYTCDLVENADNKPNIEVSSNLDNTSCAAMKKLVQGLYKKKQHKGSDEVNLNVYHDAGSASWFIKIATANHGCMIQINDGCIKPIDHIQREVKTTFPMLMDILSLMCKMSTRDKKNANGMEVTRKILLNENDVSKIAFDIESSSENTDTSFIYSLRSR